MTIHPFSARLAATLRVCSQSGPWFLTGGAEDRDLRRVAVGRVHREGVRTTVIGAARSSGPGGPGVEDQPSVGEELLGQS